MGFNPSIDGEVIRIILAPMTGEDREKYIKLVNTKLENARVMIRQIRADAMQSLKKTFETKEITEDQRKGKEKKVQEITDEFILKVEDAAKDKTLQLGQV